jgi:hypothetical protein
MRWGLVAQCGKGVPPIGSRGGIRLVAYQNLSAPINIPTLMAI